MDTTTPPKPLVARKPLRYAGQSYRPGEELNPQPAGLMREKLLRGGYVVVAGDSLAPTGATVGTPRVPAPPAPPKKRRASSSRTREGTKT